MKNFKQELKTAYNADAKRRDDADGTRAQWKLDLRQEFVDLLKNEEKKTILELGAGAGLDSQFFKENGFDVLATDLSDEMVRVCKKRGLEASTFDLYDLSKLQRKFDSIFSLNVLLHVPRKDIKTVLEGIYNTLNDNGIFFFGVYGGKDEEKIITDNTKMGLPRFFSFLSNETILELVMDKFEVIKFETRRDKSDEDPWFHFQSLFLRKK